MNLYIHKSVSLGLLMAGLLICSCTNSGENKNPGQTKEVKFITLDPGHFHAALVQKTQYENVSDTVYVYAPEGDDLRQHLSKVEAFNNRETNPTSWKEIIYTGDDFLEKMKTERPGNVVVLAGNNRIKIGYIKSALESGLNVLADKPVIINPDDFDTLKECFKIAEEKNLIFYDIMTERYEITTELQRELSMDKSIYGEQLPGTLEEPAITKESVHHFYKNVDGKALTRPAWFYNVEDQGEGIIDVTTHLVDLVQWECFPDQIIDYTKDIVMLKAKRWPTEVTSQQFKMSTGLDTYPDYLSKDVKENVLYVYANGEMNYTIKGVNAKILVKWNFQAPEGGGDTHYSVMRGSKSNLIIRQGEEQHYRPELYIEPSVPMDSSEVEKSFEGIVQKYPGVSFEKTASGWHVSIPDSYRVGHEAHFGQVTKNFLKYLSEGKLPEWEVPNMIAKYYTTTSTLKVSGSKEEIK